MANEVTKETEESANTGASVSEQTNTNPSGEASSGETPVSQETNANASAAGAANTQPAANSAGEGAATSDAQSSSNNEEDFGSILEKFEQEQTVYHSGEMVEGKVVGVSERGVLIDFGYKSEGIVPIEDFTSPTGEVTVAKGDEVEVIIKSISSGDAPPVLSRADAVSRKSWDAVEKAYNSETPITGRVVEVTKGGLRIDINGVEAFLPGSQADSRPIRNLNSFVGQDIEAKVIKFSRKRNNIVLSRKVLTDEVVNKQKAETLGNIEEGYIIEGTIKNLTEYGAFVDIGGIDGLLHVTDMSWGRLQNPGDQFKVGDTVQVKVLKLDREKEKVALGYKQLIPDPWSTVMEIYPVNAKINGRVSSVTDYGAFIELEPGVEGLVHVSEMSWSKRSQSPKKLVRPGDEVEVQVLGIDTEDRRISLGMKQLQPNPWQTVHERYRIGQTVRGKVRNLTDFGAFIEIEDGIDGLVHVSDISHSKKIKHPKDVLKRDQEVEAVIRSIDTDNRRMSLSIKELTPSAWEQFVSTHKPGDVVRGRISRFTGFGVFVELGNELEGLCHISELSDERIDRPEDIGSIGQEMDFKILRIEQDTQKIGLSARAVGKEEEPVIDTRSYSTEAKSGMASLGELMNLKRGSGGGTDESRDEPRLSKKERKALQAQERAEKERLEAERAAAAKAEQKATDEAAAATAAEAGSNTDAGTDTETNQSESQAEISAATNDEATGADSETADQTTAGQTAETSSGEQAGDVSSATENATANQSENSATENESIETGESSTVEENSTDSDAAVSGAVGEATTGESNTAETDGETTNTAGESQTTDDTNANSFDTSDEDNLLELPDDNSARAENGSQTTVSADNSNSENGEEGSNDSEEKTANG